MSDRPSLRLLAEGLGISSAYDDVAGRRHETSDATREALVAALGFDGSTEEAAARSLVRRAEKPEPALPEGPESCPRPADVLGDERAAGACLFLATVGSARSWGAGDLTDLAETAERVAAGGGRFVALNPLHDVRHRGGEVSPYWPLSRIYRDALYLDVEAVPELAESDEARALLAGDALRAELARVRACPSVPHEDVLRAKRSVLAALHRTFRARHLGRPTDRGRAHSALVARDGETLAAHATFRALDESPHLEGLRDWHAWPAELQDASSPAVRRFRDEHQEDVGFHAWLQLEVERQLGEAARRAREAGLSLGFVGDLALGSAGTGFDTWFFRGLFAEGVTLGAPPDPLGPEGQDWGLPPLDPHRLAASGLDYFARVLRSALAFAGGLRVDHALGLVRQFWIPAGRPASEGAYVRQPTEALCRVLARESRAAGALVIGEDLGTVPAELPALFQRWGILGTRVLWFERDWEGGFRPPGSWPEQALALATTHDLPTILGWWGGRDLSLRRELGLIGSDSRLAEERSARERDRRLLTDRLRADGLLADEASPDAVREAVHAFLGRTPCRLAGIWLDDLAGETEPLNVPGVPQSRHRSWTRRVRAGTWPPFDRA